jgi:hypothetical protein
MIELARGELGTTEDPAGSNMTKYGKVYGMNGVPWCVIFLWWIFNKAGERMAFFGGGKTASCSVLLRWYREQGLTVPVEDVQVGDIVLLNFHGGRDPEHCGLVVEKGPLAGTWYTIEGNTTPGEEGSQDNGGCVARKLRSVRNIVAVCRPQYKPEEPQPVDDISGHWAKASIEWAKEKGLIKGYPDGSFKPNNTLTRAEAWVMLERFYALLWEDDMR